jgi:pyrroloquinoline quinone (PQQ) biosynthesis protein C
MEAKPLRVYMAERDLGNDPFLLKVLGHIEGHSLFSHVFFEAFGQGRLILEQIKVWAKQRLFSSQRFPCFLGAFISHVVDVDVRSAYVKQIYEEHGNLNPEKVHSRQLTRLIFALGVSRQELDKGEMLAGTQRFVDTYMDISREGDLLKCMGMYALGSEPVIAMEMVLCLRGLGTIPWLKPEDVIYFSDHAYHDYRHTAELTDILLPYLKSDADRERAWKGMVEILDARKGLYDGVASSIGL